ncbi:chaperone [alpha proteobacterium U9-1i]|nr:chaperone [alpha proteobacterium U9-1i]
MSTDLAKRFYQTASVSEDGASVLLDARTLRTPGGAVFRAPARALAEAMAAEWNAQGDHIAPATMPLTQLAFAAVDITPKRRPEIAHDVAKYAETDLICHRAEAPAVLVARQAVAWDPLVAWAEQRFGQRLHVVSGVLPADVPAAAIANIERAVGDLDDFRATALAQSTMLTGSVYLGFAQLEGRINAAEAYAAATVDEAWSIERWGEDSEAGARLDRLKGDLDAVSRFLAALG